MPSPHDHPPESTKDEDRHSAPEENENRSVAPLGGPSARRAQDDRWEGAASPGGITARRATSRPILPRSVPARRIPALRAPARRIRDGDPGHTPRRSAVSRSLPRPREMDAHAKRHRRGGPAPGVRASPASLLEGQRVLLGGRRARIDMDSGFQPGGDLRGDRRAADGKHRESAEEDHQDSHGSED